MKRQGITSDTMLDIGTKVMVNSLIGKVIKAEYVSAHPCGYVCKHTIKFTDRYVRKGIGWTIKPLAASKTQSVNYAFINTI